jgi:putative membrane protein
MKKQHQHNATMKILFFIFLLLGQMTVTYAEELKPFSSDGCSSFPDGTFEQQQLWLSCCTEHDRAYWQGGSYQQRFSVDLALKNCVSAIGEPVIAELMLSGVRVGGSPYWPTKFRWGYGWPYPHGYTEGQNSNNEQKTMLLITQALIALIALLHLYFLVLEMFFWDKPLGRKTFNLTVDFAKASKNLAANQGLYNGFLAAGLIWGLLLGNAGVAIILFFLSCIVIAGVYGGLTVNKRILFIQAVPAAIALGLLLLA